MPFRKELLGILKIGRVKSFQRHEHNTNIPFSLKTNSGTG